MRRHRQLAGLLVLAFLASVTVWVPAGASQSDDDHTDNLKLVQNFPKPAADITQSDLAFWGDKLVAANYDGFRFFDISKPGRVRLIAQTYCPASQNDVSIWKNIMIASVDGPRNGENCESYEGGDDEGLRIFDVSDLRRPTMLKFIATECGSHTHTLVPDALDPEKVKNLFVYVSSYSCGGLPVPLVTVPPYTEVSIVKIPLAAPKKAKVVNQLDVLPADGCHDITVFIELKIAAGACRKEAQLWDISDPANPVITAHIANQANTFWHNAAFTWDGKYVVFGDEARGGTGPACPVDSTPIGGIWAYEVANPTAPVGVWYVPRGQGTDNCTAHNFNFIPVGERYLLAAGNYSAGVSVIDFTDPSALQEIAYYDAAEPTSDVWSAYFYNGYIYANDINRGLDVYSFKDPASKQAVRFPFMNPQTQMEVLFKP